MKYPNSNDAAKLAYDVGQQREGWYGVIFAEDNGDLGVIWWVQNSRGGCGRYRIMYWYDAPGGDR